MKTLVITDLHFMDKPRGLLKAQKDCIIKIIKHEDPDEVIILGDLMMHRKPSPSVLLALKSVVDFLQEKKIITIILRGNHDSETKADDGVTALSLYTYHAKVITQTWFDHKTKRAFIPHYENEERIKEDLQAIPKGYTMFGHFGYYGSLNSVGDADFTLNLSDFRTPSLLGHIHRFSQKENVTVLGTQYTTNFGECDKESCYAILRDGSVEFKPVTFGPRHLLFDYSELLENVEFINDPAWFTMLRVMIGKDSGSIPYDKLNVSFLDIKWKPSFDEDEVNSYSPQRSLFNLNEVIIEDYVDSVATELEKEDIMEGYKLIRDED
jgi:predicted phosphodiesterase